MVAGDGVAFTTASPRKQRTHPQLLGHPHRCGLVVLATEIGGRWSQETSDFFRALARDRLRSESPLLHKRVEQAWRNWLELWLPLWWQMGGVGADGDFPAAHEVEAERFTRVWRDFLQFCLQVDCSQQRQFVGKNEDATQEHGLITSEFRKVEIMHDQVSPNGKCNVTNDLHLSLHRKFWGNNCAHVILTADASENDRNGHCSNLWRQAQQKKRKNHYKVVRAIR